MKRDMPLDEPQKKDARCFGRTVHLQAGMRIAVCIGTLVILALVVLLYMKFKKAMFVLLIPSTRHRHYRIRYRRQKASLCLAYRSHFGHSFHVILACYALLIFSFYFFFKPLYIIMVLNWAFDSKFLTCLLVFVRIKT
ncbi:hypothetical protein OSTOST_04291 [Ostertagia ostertagi]